MPSIHDKDFDVQVIVLERDLPIAKKRMIIGASPFTYE